MRRPPASPAVKSHDALSDLLFVRPRNAVEGRQVCHCFIIIAHAARSSMSLGGTLRDVGINRHSPEGGWSFQYSRLPSSVLPYSSTFSARGTFSSSVSISPEEVPPPQKILSTCFPSMSQILPSMRHRSTRLHSPLRRASANSRSSDFGIIAEKSSAVGSANANPILFLPGSIPQRILPRPSRLTPIWDTSRATGSDIF